MSVSVPGLEVAGPVRDTLRRGVLLPAWVVTAALVVLFALGVSVSPRLQAVPLVASVLVLGLPHGAIDHLALPRVCGESPTPRAMGVVVAVYVALGGLYAGWWFLAPASAFAFFIALTWAHWGQGDLYVLLAVARAEYLRTVGQRALAAVVRGGLPMLVPLLAFPEWYRRVADALVSLFALGSASDLAWAFRADTRLALGAAYAAVVLGYFLLGYARAEPADRPALAVDAAEVVLLAVYFLVVPPLLAVGAYFCVWHAYRHIARLVLLEPDSRAAVEGERLWLALRRFAREATPLTLASVALLVGFYYLVPNPPADVLGWLGLYLAFIAVVTLPHVAIVSVMDREQSVWTG